MQGGFLTVEDVGDAIAKGDAQLWTGRDSLMATIVNDYPATGERVIEVFAAGGKLPEIMCELYPRAEAWARAIGCTAISVEGRPGWTRLLARDGFEIISTTCAKRLTPDNSAAGHLPDAFTGERTPGCRACGKRQAHPGAG